LQHKGKRLLLPAATIYGTLARVPKGEANFIFLYIVSEINEDCQTASIEYEGKYVMDGGREFKTYPPHTASDYIIENYRLSLLKEDNDLFNRYLGLINKEINDQKDKELKKQAESKKSSLTDVSDIDQKIEEGMTLYDLLVMEFEAAGPRREHVVTGGKDNIGRLTEKQDWSECFIVFHMHLLLANLTLALTLNLFRTQAFQPQVHLAHPSRKEELRQVDHLEGRKETT
jgi:hypothetical protein